MSKKASFPPRLLTNPAIYSLGANQIVAVEHSRLQLTLQLKLLTFRAFEEI